MKARFGENISKEEAELANGTFKEESEVLEENSVLKDKENDEKFMKNYMDKMVYSEV